MEIDLAAQSTMSSIVIKMILNALALLVGAYFLKGVEIENFAKALIAAIILAVLNATIGPIMHFFSYPLKLITLGFFSIIIDALIIMIAAYFLKGFKVNGFGSALLLAILVAIFNSFLYTIYL